jgi:hypothetical protein
MSLRFRTLKVVEKKTCNDPSIPSSPNGVRSLEDLAAQQGITPMDDLDALLGKPSPEDESVDEFQALLRGWRRKAAKH